MPPGSEEITQSRPGQGRPAGWSLARSFEGPEEETPSLAGSMTSHLAAESDGEEGLPRMPGAPATASFAISESDLSLVEPVGK